MGINTDYLISDLKSTKEALKLKAAKSLQQIVNTGVYSTFCLIKFCKTKL